jgi:hypothetical protein
LNQLEECGRSKLFQNINDRCSSWMIDWGGHSVRDLFKETRKNLTFSSSSFSILNQCYLPCPPVSLRLETILENQKPIGSVQQKHLQKGTIKSPLLQKRNSCFWSFVNRNPRTMKKANPAWF